jgi:hypothetical protein
VSQPVAVRYAFHIDPRGMNLYSREGLPASPFRSDDWPVESLDALVEEYQTRTPEQLASLLVYPAEMTSHAAAKALAGKGEERALPIVDRLLGGDDPDARAGALRTLGYLYWLGPVAPGSRYYGVEPQAVTPAVAKALDRLAAAGDDPDEWVRCCAAEALGMIGTDDRRTYELVKQFVVDDSPRVRTIAARLTKFRIKKHEHNVGIAYALLKARPFGDRTSVECVTNVLNHARLTGPVDLKTIGRFLGNVGPGQGGEFIDDLGDALRRIKMDDGAPSLNHPDAMPGILNLYSIGYRNYMLYGVERWIARPQNVPDFQSKIDELENRIEQLRRDKPGNWPDLVGRYEDAIEGLRQLVQKSRAAK